MMRHLHALAAMCAALLFGCGGADTSFNELGEEIQCNYPEASERKYESFPGYDPEGCTRSERMAHVIPWADEDDRGHEFGTLQQPITIGAGTDTAFSVNVDSQNRITSTNGSCKPKANWTPAMPIADRCVVPFRVGGLDFSICPTCYSLANRNYVGDRMREAWGVWSRSVTCGSQVVTTALKSPATAERLVSTSAQENFDNARIPVYPRNDNFNTQYSARAEIDKDVVVPFSGSPFGVKYYGWEYAGIALNHDKIEGFRFDACVDPGDPQAATKLRGAYRWILAHELGHLLGMPHRNTGIMRPSNMVDCSEMFTTNSSNATNGAARVERAIVNSLRDSTGINVDLQADLAGTSCSVAGSNMGVPDDIFIGNFF